MFLPFTSWVFIETLLLSFYVRYMTIFCLFHHCKTMIFLCEFLACSVLKLGKSDTVFDSLYYIPNLWSRENWNLEHSSLFIGIHSWVLFLRLLKVLGSNGVSYRVSRNCCLFPWLLFSSHYDLWGYITRAPWEMVYEYLALPQGPGKAISFRLSISPSSSPPYHPLILLFLPTKLIPCANLSIRRPFHANTSGLGIFAGSHGCMLELPGSMVNTELSYWSPEVFLLDGSPGRPILIPTRWVSQKSYQGSSSIVKSIKKNFNLDCL